MVLQNTEIRRRKAEREPEREHIPIEIFGYPHTNNSEDAKWARNNFFCPFINDKCKKQTRMLNHPLGVCSVLHDGNVHIICPYRFYFDNLHLLKKVAKQFGVDFALVSEVRMKDFGNVDWVAFTLDSNRSIKDFIGMEIMANDTTQTGEIVRAVKDFFSQNRLDVRYRYGLNTLNAIKLSFVQMMNKGQIFERWGKKYVWIVQDILFENFVNRFKLNIKEGAEKSIVYYTVNIRKDKKNDVFTIQQSKIYSATISELLKAYNRKDVPPINDFIEAIKRKVKKKNMVKLNKFF